MTTPRHPATPWLGPFAALLAAEGFGTWAPDLPYGPDPWWPIHLEHLPPTPDLAIGLTAYGAAPAAHDIEPLVQLRVRGDRDPRTSHSWCSALCEWLHHLTGGIALPDGPWLVCAPSINGGPVAMGPDEQGRYRHITNHHLTITRS